ncbi:hypothetical protein ACET3Z_032213 [Daucus carota]
MKNSSVMLFISLAMILAISGLRLSNGLAEGIVARAPYHAGAPNHILNAYDCSKDESICSKRRSMLGQKIKNAVTIDTKLKSDIDKCNS